MVSAQEFAQDLHDGGFSDEPSRLESSQDQAVQDLCHFVSQGEQFYSSKKRNVVLHCSFVVCT